MSITFFHSDITGGNTAVLCVCKNLHRLGQSHGEDASLLSLKLLFYFPWGSPMIFEWKMFAAYTPLFYTIYTDIYIGLN